MTRIDKKVAKCPVCKETIFSATTYKDFVNDKGGIIIKLDECNHIFPFPISNPNDATIEGGTKLDVWDSDVEGNEERILEKHGFKNKNQLPCEVVIIDPNTEPVAIEYSLDDYPIFYDPISKINYEKIAYEKLKIKIKDIQKVYDSYLNIYYGGRWGSPKQIYIILTLPDNNKAFFYRSFKERIKFKNNLNQNLLADIKDFSLSDNLDGTFTKDESLSILRKCIIRWNAIAQHILIATPFVGHQWNKDFEIYDLWEWLLNYLEMQKSTLITRKASLDKFKNLSNQNGFNIDKLKEFNITMPVIEEYIKKQDFHAKFYAGVSNDYSEILSGSVNILKGPSIENFSFKKQTTNAFNIKYLSKMKINKLNMKRQEQETLVIYDDTEGNFDVKLENQELDAQELVEKYYNK